MSRAGATFRPATLIAMLAVGALAFLLLLYALGQGWTGDDGRNGGAHAASNSLNGFSGIAQLLERRGYDVSLSRSQARLDEEVLLVLTPGQFADADEISALLEDRQYAGPTLLILPKWFAAPVPDDPRIEAEEGWVVLGDTWSPDWLVQTEQFAKAGLATGSTRGWQGMGLSGRLPDPAKVQAIGQRQAEMLYPMVRDSEGDLLAGYLNAGGYFPDLADASNVRFSNAQEEEQDDSIWPVVVVIEPDLMNNYGMADQERARLAVALVKATFDGSDNLPIVFDLTLPGLGNSANLLTLAFRPPFLAATLCLLLAALVIAWRAFRRFGPPVAEAPALARGKTQLARNGAGLIERAKRWHLLGTPYAAMVASRIARALGIRESDPEAREAAIDAAMQAHEIDARPFSASAQALREARHPNDILHAASALRTIERKLTR